MRAAIDGEKVTGPRPDEIKSLLKIKPNFLSNQNIDHLTD